MKIISGNLLDEGTPVWWTGVAWSSDITLAAQIDPKAAESLEKELAGTHGQRVVSLEVVPLKAGGLMPRRQVIRQLGPTVRPDLGPLFDVRMGQAA
jgi:hypothetical protein